MSQQKIQQLIVFFLLSETDTPPDKEQGIKWLTLAAGQEYPPAMDNLGVAYATGE